MIQKANSSESGTKRPLDIAEQLCTERPMLHGRQGKTWSFGIHRKVLRFLAQQVGPEVRSLETGCGLSTIVFAAGGGAHTVVSPVADEHQKIQDWCRKHEISCDQVEFLVGDSRELLPSLHGGPLDLVLIDGCHALPTPFIDWYYTARRLEVGGTLVVDDTHIRTGSILRDFLEAEDGRWELRQEFRHTSVFEKLHERVIDGIWWGQQPYCAKTHRFRRVDRVARRLLDAVFLRQTRSR